MKKLVLAVTSALFSSLSLGQVVIQGSTYIDSSKANLGPVAEGRGESPKITTGYIRGGTQIKGNTNIKAKTHDSYPKIAVGKNKIEPEGEARDEPKKED